MMTHSSIQARSESGGILGKLLLWLVVLAALGAIAWIVFLPKVVASQIQSKTGFAVAVDHLSVNPFTANVSIRGLVLKNPAGWPTDAFLDLREFKADAKLTSLFSDRMTANEVVLDIARFTLVKNQQGVLNAKAFSDAIMSGGSEPAPKSEGPAKKFLIKHLVLKFDQLVYADHSGAQPSVKEYDLHLQRDLQDVDSVAKIINPISTASFGVIADALGGVLNGRTDLLKDVSGAIQDAGKKTGEKLKGFMDSLDKKKP